jgi:hypothetical protein
MADAPIIIPPAVQAKIAETQANQAADDQKGSAALTSALPGPLRDIFAPAPDIKAGKYNVRRFVDRDFMFLSQLGHPLNRFTAMADGSYNFEPSGPLAWQLCWLLTRPIAAAKDEFKKGADHVKELAEDEFGDNGVIAIAAFLTTIAKQMEIYAQGHLELKEKPSPSPGGDEASPPSSSQP